MVELYPYQKEAVDNLKCGSILCGGVGSGKSLTSIAYYQKTIKKNKHYIPLYIITTARKRDTGEWETDLAKLGIVRHFKVDSWNNISKYQEVRNAFFIFDEQRVVGYGAWTKSFLRIAKYNHWILLSATPGDTWYDYIPVFIANGFYRNKTEFVRRHVVYSRFSKFPKVDHYVDTGILVKHRKDILVNMDYFKKTVGRKHHIMVDYDHEAMNQLMKKRWNPRTNLPVKDAGELCLCMRYVSNTSLERIQAVRKICKERKKVIIFYNFNYELDILRDMCKDMNKPFSEWNGQKHEPIPHTVSWAYLVQYTAGAEGWNCIETDTIIFYSLNYSYKIMTQAAGRIDRLNTPFHELHYYYIRTGSGIDSAIMKALNQKRNFSESAFFRESREKNMDSNRREKQLQ